MDRWAPQTAGRFSPGTRGRYSLNTGGSTVVVARPGVDTGQVDTGGVRTSPSRPAQHNGNYFTLK